MTFTPDLAFAFVLALAAIVLMLLSARANPASRNYARLAGVLYFALALTSAVSLVRTESYLAQVTNAVALMVCALGPACLTLAVYGAFVRPPSPWAAGLVLVASCLCGLAAQVTDIVLLAIAPLAFAALVLIVLALRSLRERTLPAICVLFSSAALIAAAAAFLAKGEKGFVLFSAAFLLGVLLATMRHSDAHVERKADRPGMMTAVDRER